MRTLVGVSLILLLAAAGTSRIGSYAFATKGGHGGPPDCGAARCSVQAAVDQACACDTAVTHGSYVKCVAHTIKALVSSGQMDRRCKGKVVRCAAHSTCGKMDAVTCLVSNSCAVAKSADACQARGGTAGPVGSCCALCASPSGAFIDGRN